MSRHDDPKQDVAHGNLPNSETQHVIKLTAAKEHAINSNLALIFETLSLRLVTMCVIKSLPDLNVSPCFEFLAVSVASVIPIPATESRRPHNEKKKVRGDLEVVLIRNPQVEVFPTAATKRYEFLFTLLCKIHITFFTPFYLKT